MSIQVCLSYAKITLSYIGMVSAVWGIVDVIPLYIRAGLAPPTLPPFTYVYTYIFFNTLIVPIYF